VPRGSRHLLSDGSHWLQVLRRKIQGDLSIAKGLFS